MEGRDRAVKVAVFSAKDYDREFLAAANNSRHEFRFFDLHLNEETVGLAARFHAVCVFVNDHVDDAVVAKLAALGVRLIALRCAGYNNVDLTAAKEHAIVRGPDIRQRRGWRNNCYRPHPRAQSKTTSRLTTWV